MDKLKAPFPWFGGKSQIAPLVWRAFGDVANYIEPFAGSLAVLLARPTAPRTETINDIDCFVANFWRSMTQDPNAVAHYADWPVNEADLHARHLRLVHQKQFLSSHIMADPDFFDAKIAGWWVWGLCSWIGKGWCSGDGPWVLSEDGHSLGKGDAGQGINRKLPHLGDAGRGINRQLPHLGDAGRGINRQLPYLGDGRGEWIRALAERLSRVRVACGDWSRVCGPSVTHRHGLTGVLLDPPYLDGDIQYGGELSAIQKTWADLAAWARTEGENPLMRIALCGYEGHFDPPVGWVTHAWKARGGYGSQGNDEGRENAKRERIWLSPHCLRPTGQLTINM